MYHNNNNILYNPNYFFVAVHLSNFFIYLIDRLAFSHFVYCTQIKCKASIDWNTSTKLNFTIQNTIFISHDSALNLYKINKTGLNFCIHNSDFII